MFAWTGLRQDTDLRTRYIGRRPLWSGLLAGDTSYFGGLRNMDYFPTYSRPLVHISRRPYFMTNRGLEMTLRLPRNEVERKTEVGLQTCSILLPINVHVRKDSRNSALVLVLEARMDGRREDAVLIAERMAHPKHVEPDERRDLTELAFEMSAVLADTGHSDERDLQEYKVYFPQSGI